MRILPFVSAERGRGVPASSQIPAPKSAAGRFPLARPVRRRTAGRARVFQYERMKHGRPTMYEHDAEGLILSILACLVSTGFFGAMMVGLFRIATGA
jgi:hypothetical protein